MRTINYLTLILSFTLLFASCKKDEDAAENTPTPTPAVSQEYTVDMVLKYTGNLKDGSIVKYNDKDGREQQEVLDKTKTEWKKTIIVKKGFKVLVRGEFNVIKNEHYQFQIIATGLKKDGGVALMGNKSIGRIPLPTENTIPIEYTGTI
jgi:hypothetical protein